MRDAGPAAFAAPRVGDHLRQHLAGKQHRQQRRGSERRLTALKSWRAEKATALDIDPGVLCPNSALEAIAWQDPKSKADLQAMSELKGWFVRDFGAEVAKINREATPSPKKSFDSPSARSWL